MAVMTLAQPPDLRLALPLDHVAAICGKYRVSQLAVFGSALRDDFGPQSDIDFLVRFHDNDAGPWMSKFMDMEQELAALLRRNVDLVDWNGIEQSENPYRKRRILRSARMVYAD